MKDLRKQMGMACAAALLGTTFMTPTALAEGRNAAPIVFAGGAHAQPTRPVGAGPIDLRYGAQPTRISAPTTLAPNPAAQTSHVPAGWSRPYAGPPYQVNGKWFVPMHEPDYDEVGIASWYGPGFDGEVGASGEIFEQDALTAAHPTLPIPSVVRVTNLENNRSVLLRLNDRGPYVDDRIIDLSRGAADALDVRKNGTAKVRVQYVGAAPSDPDVALTERMFAGQTTQPVHTAPTPTPRPSPRQENVWTATLPPASGMPAHPPSQVPAPPEEAAAPAPAPATPTDGGFAIQAGSFSDLANAHRVLAGLNSVSPGYVSSAVVNGSQFYRVMLGPVADRSAAETLQNEVRSRGTNTLLVELVR